MKTYEQIRKFRNELLYPDGVPLEGEDLYRCNRVWEAWQYGTMTEDDFELVERQEKEVTTNDILRMMDRDYYKGEEITTSIYLGQNIGEGLNNKLVIKKNGVFATCIEVIIDLTLPISEQSEETLLQLIKLIK